MELENIENYKDLVNFFKGRGFDDYNEDPYREFKVSKLYKIRLKEIDRFPESVAELSRYRTELKRIGGNVTYYLLYTQDFNKFAFMRQVGDPFKFAYDKDRIKKLPTETRLSLLKKLHGLKYKDDLFNETLENLFDVKEIVNTFFKEYKDIVKRLGRGITIRDVNPELYAQILMDRIIFLYFLQTKGVLDEKYLSDNYHGKDKCRNYYRDFLRPLFFEILNNEKHDKNKDIIINEVNFGRLPYLNGGLFREKEFEKEDIEVDDSVWGEVFGLLNRYEWVVEEQKGDSTVLTPAILGHIYEKSVIAATQKGTGSYYTPQEITNYISMDTIYPYLTDGINEKFETKYISISHELLNKKNHSEKDIKVIRFLYFDVLKELTILDNACGSGAFLVAALYVLIPLYRKCISILLEKDKENFEKELEEIQKHQTLEYYIKRTVITNNLYGVDIQKEAVEIAKLRLWLSMVSDVDKDYVEPLPNIDYNIMWGNSLIGFVEAPDDEQFALTAWTLEEVKPEQRTLTKSKKYQTRMKPETVKEIMKHKGMYVRDYKKTKSSEHAEELKKQIDRINRKFRPGLDEKLLREFQDKKIKITDKELEDLHPFHWGFEFYDVFNPDKPKEERGFGIVIGNPPYVDYRSIDPFIQTKIFKRLYYSCKNTNEKYSLYIPFVEAGLNLINQKGYFCYINPSKWLSALMAEGLRGFIRSYFHIYEMVNLAHMKVFPDPTFTNLGLFFIKQKGSSNITKIKYKPQSYDDLRSNPILINEDSLYYKNFIVLAKSAKELSGMLNYLDNFKNKLKNDLVLEWGSSASGFSKRKITKEEYLKFSKVKKGEYMRVIQTSNCKRYRTEDSKEYIPTSLYSKRRLRQFSKEKIVIARRSADLQCTIDPKGYALGKVAFSVSNRMPLFQLTVILDSKLINFWFKKTFESLHPGGSYQFDIPYLYHIPIPKMEEGVQTPFIHLCDYMLFLNKTEERRKSEKELIDFIDRQIIDSLVYELYFKDELRTNLLELVEPYLKETDRLDEIRKIVDKIKSDKEIIKTIDKIKNHKWVKVIEGG